MAKPSPPTDTQRIHPHDWLAYIHEPTMVCNICCHTCFDGTIQNCILAVSVILHSHSQAISPSTVLYQHSPSDSGEYHSHQQGPADAEQVQQHHQQQTHHHQHQLVSHHSQHQPSHVESKYSENVNGHDTLTDFVTFVCQEAENSPQSSQVT